MNPISLASAALAIVGVTCIVAIVIGAMASTIGDRPGEHAVTTLGHRAVGWTCAFCLLGLGVMLALEHWGVQ